MAYPNVPAYPGVPSLPRAAGAIVAVLQTALTGDDPSINSATIGPQWGLFDDGNAAVIEADSVLSFGIRRSFKASDFPVEQGEFRSYDKVETPFDVRMSVTKGGSPADRTMFLQSLDTAIESLELYTAVMPEMSYTNVNVVDYNLERRATNGVTLIVVDIMMRQIRDDTNSTALSSTVQPNSEDGENIGGVQTQNPTLAQQQAAQDII